MSSPQQSSATFRAMHESGCFVLPNPWDIGTAIYLEHLGFEALATTSAGFAFSRGKRDGGVPREDRKSTRLNSSHEWISYAVFCLKKKKINIIRRSRSDPAEESLSADSMCMARRFVIDVPQSAQVARPALASNTRPLARDREHTGG